jgi:hypothetical protein
MARLPYVQAVEAAPRPRTLSGLGTSAIGAPSWWAAGLTGGTGPADTVPADAAVLSEAADPTHPAFAGTDVDNDPTQSVTDHGTHTGGIIASGDGTYRGVSYGLDTLIGSSNESYALGLAAGSGAVDPAETINVSFGSVASSDDEDHVDDVLTNVFGVGQAFGAGNENIDGTPTVGNIGRNVLTVGGFNDVGTVDPTDDVVLGISSRGPTPGGRKKPDLTAPAAAVMAPSMHWNSPSTNPDFTPMTGTSFAAPHVAGAMTLLEGAGIGDPMAQRAILINSARDWGGAATGLAGWTPPQSGWRPEVGWGQLDLTRALAERSNYRLGGVAGYEAAYYAATMPTGAKATLAYELRGYFTDFPNPGTQTLTYTQSNLDLHQYLDDGTEITPPADPGHGGGPDAIDPNDTVEQVRAPAGGPSDVILKVEAASTVEGAAVEPFAITAGVPLAPLDPATVEPTDIGRTPDGPVRCGRQVTVTASLTNPSDDLAADGATVALETPPDIDIVAGAREQAVSGGDLDPGETSGQHSWIVEAKSHGDKEVTVTGTGGALGTEFERAEPLSIEVDCTAPSTSIDSGPSGTTNASAPRFTFSATGDAATYECSIDDGAFGSCVSPRILTGLGDGRHAFAVRARDAAGNIDPTPARRTFTIDRIVSGTGLRPGSGRVGPGGRYLGSVRVRIGEPGQVRLGASARVGGKRRPLVTHRVEFAAAGRHEVRLRVPRKQRRTVRRAIRKGRGIKTSVVAAFGDEAGNMTERRVRFTAGR